MLLALGRVLGIYSGRWLRSSFEEAYATAATAAGATLTAFALDLLLHRPIPVSATLGSIPIAIGALTGVRVIGRLCARRPDLEHTAKSRVVVFGAGHGGRDILAAMRRDPSGSYAPVALLDDDPDKRNLQLSGVRVRGDRTALERVAREFSADTLVIAVPSADAALMRDLTDRGTSVGLTVKALPSVAELFDKRVHVSDIRPVTVSDLLGRREIDVDIDSIAGYLTDRRVLITGAGGSIGSELCRQVRRFHPASLAMLDRDESALHMLQMSIEGRAMLDDRSLVVADIRDQARMRQVFEEHDPEVVFHAAALKHLPLLEMHPAEAVKTNVLGTQNLLTVAMESNVRCFVNISTDKAADPISVLGFSKRIAERLTAWYDVKSKSDDQGRCLSVRFGNVLGSRGSVLTAFRAQIAAHGPLTVTHPDVTRYFMTVEEAVRLVIQAGAIGVGGEVLVLDMGEPVRITDVAERLIRESREEIHIEYTGLRPGEKLNELLLGVGEKDERPTHPYISQVPVPPISPVEIVDLTRTTNERDLIDGLRRTAYGPLRLFDESATSLTASKGVRSGSGDLRPPSGDLVESG
jgi:FlaA1/EpsC-like NDP-sugar epimerase